MKAKLASIAQRSFKERLEDLRKDSTKNRDKALALLNTRHISIRVGRQHSVCDITVSEKGILPQQNHDFVEKYRTFVYKTGKRMASGEFKRKTLGELWLQWEGRRAFDGTLTFEPPGALTDSEDDGTRDNFNTWRGFRVTPKPGKWNLFNDHLLKIVCRGHTDWHEYLLNYVADMVQRPGRLPKVCTVIQGSQGTGKTHVYDVLANLFHRFNRALLDNPKHVVGNFNMHQSEKILICADEAIFARDKAAVGKLKSMITHPEQYFEAKGFDSVPMLNCARLIIISNDEHIVHADADERRYFVLRTADTYAQQPNESLRDANKRRATYFDPISKQMNEEGGTAAMLHDLTARDLSDFNLLEFPDTPFLTDQKKLSWAPHEKWLANKLLEGHFWFNEPETRPSKRMVYNDYKDEAPRYNRRSPTMDETQFGRFLVAVFGSGIGEKRQGRDTAGKQITVYWFPPLEDARRLWEQYSGTSGQKLRVRLQKPRAESPR